MTIVESLKKVVKAYGGEDSNANTIVEGLRDIVTAMGGTTADGNTVAQVIEDIAAAVPGSGGGGGGSSDFSTAEVVVTNNSNSFVTILIPNIVAEGEEGGITNAGYPEGSSPLTLEVPVYKGSCFCPNPFSFNGPPVTVTVTGDITWNSETTLLNITGDGTITLS